MKKVTFILSFLFLTGCSELRVFQPISEAGREQAFLIKYGFWLMMIVLLVVTVLYVRFVIKYKETAKNKEDVPSEIDSNLKLELSWTIFPILILIALAIPTVMITYENSPSAYTKEEGIDIFVTARQFSWEFEYETGLSSVNELIVPVGETAVLHLTSDDVIHSFWVPEFGGKQDAIPGKEIVYTITPEQVGTYMGQCAEFCGIEHTKMEFTAKVVSMQEYNEFLTGNDDQEEEGGK